MISKLNEIVFAPHKNLSINGYLYTRSIFPVDKMYVSHVTDFNLSMSGIWAKLSVKQNSINWVQLKLIYKCVSATCFKHILFVYVNGHEYTGPDAHSNWEFIYDHNQWNQIRLKIYRSMVHKCVVDIEWRRVFGDVT